MGVVVVYDAEESRIARRARKRGWQLRKARLRRGAPTDRRFMLVALRSGALIAGDGVRGYGLTLDEIASVLDTAPLRKFNDEHYNERSLRADLT
jgi:hypothetical protein